jgi:hypothetical protein
MKGRAHVEDLGLDERLILKWNGLVLLHLRRLHGCHVGILEGT